MIKISRNGFGYFLNRDNENTPDIELAKYLEIPIKKYIKMMKKRNAIEKHKEHWFETLQDAEEFLTDLEPYIVLKVITS